MRTTHSRARGYLSALCGSQRTPVHRLPRVTLDGMLRRLKQYVVDRLGITRVASSADHSLRSMQEIRLWREVELTSQVMSVTEASATSVSVVMATRNRRSLCRRAIGSVLAQRHANWQLVVVDDGSDDGTSDLAAEIADSRITWLRTEGIGASAARNVGLEHASGEWVTFLDDDNLMDAGWLHAIVVHADRHPECSSAYGAQLRQREATAGPSSLPLPWILLAGEQNFAELEMRNCIDLGALAVRRRDPDLWFRDDLSRFIDWEMVIRLHRAHGLCRLPVWTGVYNTDAPRRLTSVGGEPAADAFRARIADPLDPAGTPGMARAAR